MIRDLNLNENKGKGLLKAGVVVAIVTAIEEQTKDPNLGKGRICGRDDGGKSLSKPQKRNRPCMCGSGKKAKKCCG